MKNVCLFRGLKDMESDISSIEKRFAYGFLQKLLKWMDIAQEFIAHLGKIPLHPHILLGEDYLIPLND